MGGGDLFIVPQAARSCRGSSQPHDSIVWRHASESVLVVGMRRPRVRRRPSNDQNCEAGVPFVRGTGVIARHGDRAYGGATDPWGGGGDHFHSSSAAGGGGSKNY